MSAAAFAQSADLAVSKTGPASGVQGSNITYAVIVTNHGPSAAATVTLTDDIPVQLQFVSATQDSGPAFLCTNSPADTITCTSASLPAGESAAFSFEFQIVAEGPFANVASVDSPTPDPNQGNDSDDATTDTLSADLSVLKTGPASAPAGSDVTYTVVVRNNGPDESFSVVMTDQIPEGMTFVSATEPAGFDCSDPGVGNEGDVICSAASLPAAASAAFTFVFNIPVETPAGTFFTNIVSVGSLTNDPTSENNAAAAVTSTPFPPSADLAVTKTGPAAAGPDTDITYTITLTNFGPGAATNVTLEDELPGTATFVDLGVSGTPMNCTTPAIGAGGTITCTSASFPASATTTFTLTIHIPAETPSGTAYGNSVDVTSTNDPNEENNVAGTLTTVSQVDVSVVKTGDGAVLAGATATYTIIVSNGGPDDASGVTLTDQLPPNTTLASFAQNSGPTAGCVFPPPGATGTVSCTIEFLSATPAQFTLRLVPGDTTGFTNTATVTTPFNFDADTDDHTSSVTTTVTPQANLAVTKNGPATVTAGSDLTYTVTLTNNGPSTASNVSLTDDVPANTTFVSAIQTSGPAFSCGNAAGTITCTIASLAPGATATFDFTVHVAPGATGSIDNTANVSTTTADPAGGNNTSNVSSTVTPSADLAVVKSGPSAATPDTNVTYSVTVTNNGPSTASNVSLTDDVPANTTFVSAIQTGGPTFSCGNAAGTITCTIASLAPGATATFDFTVHVAPGAVGSIDNTANVSATTADPAGGNNTSNVSSTVTPSADLAVVKSGPATATSGTNITYTVTATNNGPSTSTNVTLTDVLPPGTTFVSATQDSGPAFPCGEAAGTITCTIASFVPSTPATFTFVFAIAPGAVGAIDNTATIASASTPDPAGANNTSTTTASLGGTADLGVTKSGPTAVTAGSNLTYTVTATNAGPSAATTVTLTDTLPSNATFVSIQQTSGPTFDCTPPAVGATGQIVCTIASFSPAATATFTIIANANAGASGAVENIVTITSSTSDPNATNNTATSTAGIDAGPTDLSITKSANGTQFAAGSTVTYTVVVTNNGPGIAFGTTVTDILPPGTTLQSATPTQGTCTGTTTVVCNLGTLAPSATATITLLLTVPATQGEIANTATVTAVNAETNGSNNSSTAALAVISQIPSLSEYGLMLLAAMLAMAGLMTIRR